MSPTRTRGGRPSAPRGCFRAWSCPRRSSGGRTRTRTPAAAARGSGRFSWPVRTLTRSCQGWLVRGNDVEPGRHRLLAREAILHVHGVVPAVAAEQPQEHGRPTAQADPLLLERLAEVELAPAHRVVGPPPLGPAVHKAPVGGPAPAGHRNPPHRLA